MTCPCTSTPLRLFIRSLTQVDLAVSARSSQRHLGWSTIRSYASTQALREQKAATPFTQIRQSSSKSSNGELSYDGGFVEISSESINALAAEVERSVSEPVTIAEDEFTERPRRPQKKNYGARIPHKGAKDMPRTTSSYKARDDTFAMTTFRRTKVENTGFALHFSAPRSPSTTVPKAAPVPRANVKETSAHSENEDDAPEYPEAWALPGRPKPSREADPIGKVDSKGGWIPPPKEPWQINKAALKEKFPDGWKPLKRLSPDALSGIRALHAHMPEVYTTAALAQSFEVSPEAIRRILKSNWSPSSDEETDRARRWFERGKKIYTDLADAGGKPPKRWREEGIGNGKPQWLRDRNERSKAERKASKLGLRPRPPLPALLAITTSPRQRRENSSDSEGSGIL